jgi:hypothetical protein
VVALGVLAACAACGNDGGDDDDDDDVVIDAPASDAGVQDAGPRVGRVCDIGFEDAGAEDPTVVATPALDCTSRICVHVEGTSPNLCTRTCTSAEQCVPALESPCEEFACVEVIDVGPFAGESFCICRDYLPDGGP